MATTASRIIALWTGRFGEMDPVQMIDVGMTILLVISFLFLITRFDP